MKNTVKLLKKEQTEAGKRSRLFLYSELFDLFFEILAAFYRSFS